MAETEIGLSVASLIGVVALFLINKFKPSGMDKIWKAIEKLCDTVSGKDGLSERLVRFETIMSFYQKHVADALHSDTSPELDKILEKISAKTPLTMEETQKAKELIIQIKQDPAIPKDRKIGYAFILSVCEADLLLRK